MILDRFGQSNNFWEKSYKKYWNIQVWVLWRSSKGRLESTSQGRPLNVRLGRPQHIILGRPRDVRSGSPRRSNRIFRGRPGDVGGECPRDVLGTNICQLGYMSRFSWIWHYSKNKDLNLAQCDSCQNWYHRKYENVLDNVISLCWHFA